MLVPDLHVDCPVDWAFLRYDDAHGQLVPRREMMVFIMVTSIPIYRNRVYR
jgi:hypothetical protein